MVDETDSPPHADHKIDRLLDAIELVRADRRVEALPLLRSLIREDSNFEDAWLWMSVAVDEIDQSIICLDNVLRINPDNTDAAIALYRLRESERETEKKRAQLRRYRDMATAAFWILVVAIMIAIVLTYTNQIALEAPPA